MDGGHQLEIKAIPHSDQTARELSPHCIALLASPLFPFPRARESFWFQSIVNDEVGGPTTWIRARGVGAA